MTKSKQQLRLKGNDWLIFPLAIAALLCVVTLSQSQITHTSLFTLPTLTLVLGGLFSSFYTYKRIAHKHTRAITTFVAYVLSVIVVGALVFTVVASSASGAAFFIWVVVLSPPSAPILSLLSVAGIIALAIPKRNKTSKRTK